MKGYHDIVGDGGSDVLGQVTRQRSRIARNLAQVRHRLAIGSGKGGVGKSTLTMQIALALRARGGEVAILDADLNGPSQARLAGLEKTPPVPGERGMAIPRSRSGIGVVSMGTMIPEPRAVEFDSVASGDSHVWRATREFSAMSELLETVDWGRLDFLLVDLPPGTERTFQYAEFLGESTSLVLVTIPSDLSRGVVARTLSALRKTPNRLLGYIENMNGYYCDGCGEIKTLFPSPGKVDLDISCLGRVPFDPALTPGGEHDDSRPAARSIREIAGKITNLLEGKS